VMDAKDQQRGVGALTFAARTARGHAPAPSSTLADPLTVTVDGAVTTDLQENLRGIERQIEQVRQAPAPDDPGDGDEDDPAEPVLAVTWLDPARRYR
jgi:hypothetical protein